MTRPSYKTYLRSIGRKPVRGPLRTKREPGHIEFMWNPEAKDYLPVVHEGEPESNVTPIRRRRAAA